MELWIRSQDKLRLAKIESAIINYNRQTEILGNCYSTDGIEKDIPLGEYATKERALEVLDEIQNLLNPMLIFKNAEVDEETLKDIRDVGACFVSNDTRLEQSSTYVYEMPKE